MLAGAIAALPDGVLRAELDSPFPVGPAPTPLGPSEEPT